MYLCDKKILYKRGSCSVFSYRLAAQQRTEMLHSYLMINPNSDFIFTCAYIKKKVALIILLQVDPKLTRSKWA